MKRPFSLSEGESNTTGRRAAWDASINHPETRNLLARDEMHFLRQSVSTPCMNAIAKAEGAFLWDLQGRRFLDFHGNNVHHIGYGHPRLKEAITKQMEELPFAPRRFACEPAVALAEKFAAIAPGGLTKTLLATGGSDANEIALKIARAATGRFKTISFWDSYHGAGFGAASVGGEAMFRSHIAGPLLPGAEHVAPFSCYRCPYGYDDIDGKPDLDHCRLTCANMLRYVLEREGDVAAVIAEPSRTAPYLSPPGFWKSVRQACDEFGALLIFDEIPTGLGKTGRLFACEHDDVEPDMIVLGKALGGGILPIAAVLAKPELDVAGDFAIGHYTHEKNPVTAQAALTTLEIIEDEDLVRNAAAVGAYALERLSALKGRFPSVGDVRGRGLLLGVELVEDRDFKSPARELAEDVFYRCLERGLTYKITMGNILTWTPPLIVTRDQIDFAVDVLEDALTEATGAGATRSK